MKKRYTITKPSKTQTYTWTWEKAKAYKCQRKSIPHFMTMGVKKKFPSLNWMPNCDLWVEIKHFMLLLVNLLILLTCFLVGVTGIIPKETVTSVLETYSFLKFAAYAYLIFIGLLIFRFLIIYVTSLADPNMLKYTRSYIILNDKPKQRKKKEEKKKAKQEKRNLNRSK